MEEFTVRAKPTSCWLKPYGESETQNPTLRTIIKLSASLQIIFLIHLKTKVSFRSRHCVFVQNCAQRENHIEVLITAL